MWKTTGSILKYTFFVVVVAVTVYNYAESKKPKETFVTNIEQEYRAAIVNIFHIILGRDPQEFEVQLYRDYMTDSNDVNKIRDKLMGSSEYIKMQKELIEIPKPVVERNPISKNAASVTDEAVALMRTIKTDEKLARYREIVKIYQDNLDRLPTLKEINYYTYRMEKDKTFTNEKLVELLQMSKEYSILQKNQTNVVNNELEGNITEAQILLIIRGAYQEVYKTTSLPSQELEEFLKMKYVEYKLDDVKFNKLLRLLRDLDSNDVDMDKLNRSLSDKKSDSNKKDQSDLKGNATAQESNDVSNLGGKFLNALNLKNKDGNGSQSQSQSQSQSKSLPSNTPTPSLPSCENKFGSSWNPTIQTDKTCKNANKQYDINKFYDTLYENIKYEQSGKTCQTGENNRNILAETQQKRNNFDIDNSCSRNNYYSQVDEEMMGGYVNAYDKNIKPQFRNTRYGSFLDDAANTKVGSIMPKFVYKEYVGEKN